MYIFERCILFNLILATCKHYCHESLVSNIVILIGFLLAGPHGTGAT